MKKKCHPYSFVKKYKFNMRTYFISTKYTMYTIDVCEYSTFIDHIYITYIKYLY